MRTITLQFTDINPRAQYEIYDDSGNVVGQLSPIEFEAKRKELEGKMQVQCCMEEAGQKRVLESPVFNPDDEDQRRAVYRSMGYALGYAIRQRIWPKDTELYKTVVTKHGIKQEVPPIGERYPE